MQTTLVGFNKRIVLAWNKLFQLELLNIHKICFCLTKNDTFSIV